LRGGGWSGLDCRVLQFLSLPKEQYLTATHIHRNLPADFRKEQQQYEFFMAQQHNSVLRTSSSFERSPRSSIWWWVVELARKDKTNPTELFCVWNDHLIQHNE
jgi:hypothetical protein